MFWDFFNSYRLLPGRAKKLLAFSMFFLFASTVLTPLVGGCAFIVVGFSLNPAARIEGMPLWMDSPGVFLGITALAGVILVLMTLASLECILRLENQSIFKSPLIKG